jgi:hypothetical protein
MTGEIRESSTAPARRTRLSCLAAGAVLLCVAAFPLLRYLSRSDGRRGRIASAIGNTRTVLSVEAAYSQTANKGWYDTLECLSHPAQCIPGYGGPPFLHEDFRMETQGYVYEFHPGRVANPAEVAKAGASPSSLEGYALVALPKPRTGDNGATCGDGSGEICQTPTGGRPRVEKGQCVITPGAPPKRHRWPWSPLPDEEPCYPLR